MASFQPTPSSQNEANESPRFKYAPAFACLLLALMGFLAGGAALRESVTFDEVAHIGAGVSYWQKLDLRFNEEHPPLAKLIAAIPLLLCGTRADYSHISWTNSTKFLPHAFVGEWIFGEWLLTRWNDLCLAGALLSKFSSGLLFFAFGAFALGTRFLALPETPQGKPELRAWRRARWQWTRKGILLAAVAGFGTQAVSWNAGRLASVHPQAYSASGTASANVRRDGGKDAGAISRVESSQFAEEVRKRGSELSIFALTAGVNIDNETQAS